MNMKTGQIVLQARRACFNSINLFTIIFAILLNCALKYADNQYNWMRYLIWSIYSLYIIQLSASLSKTNSYLQTLDLNSSGQDKPGIRIVTDNNNTVKIGQSLIDFINVVGKNLLLFSFIVFIQICVNMFLFYLIQYLLKEHMVILETLFDRAIKDMKKSGIQNPQQMQQLLYINIISQLHGMGVETLKKMNYFSFYLILAFISKLISYTILNWLKYAAVGQIQKRSQYKKNITKHPKTQQNYNIMIGQQGQLQKMKKINYENVSILYMFKILFTKFLKWKVITAQFRIYLRLGIILVFIDILDPYFYVCMGFFCEKVCKNQFLEVVEEITFIQFKNDVKLEKTTEQKATQKTQLNKQSNQQEIQKQQKIVQEEQEKIPTKVPTNNQLKSVQNLQNSITQKPQKSITQILKQINRQSDLKYKKIKSKYTNQNKKTNKRIKLVYRPYYNDVVAVKKFANEND